MSTNLVCITKYPIEYIDKKGKTRTKDKIINLPLYQTQTNVTWEILKSTNPLEAYFEWIKSWLNDEELYNNHYIEINSMISTAIFQDGGYYFTCQ